MKHAGFLCGNKANPPVYVYSESLFMLGDQEDSYIF